MAEEEAMLLSQKASEAEQEITRIRLSAMKVINFLKIISNNGIRN